MNKLWLFLLSATMAAQISGLPSSGIPVPPSGAQLYPNLQNATGWIACAQACAGGSLGITSFTQSVASPSLSGSSIKFSIANQHAITAATIGTAGTGYTAGDVVTVTQAGASGGTITVATVSSGVPQTLTVSGTTGTAYSVASGLATTGGSGTGLTINITAISGSANSLFYNKTIGCPTSVPGGCVATGIIHILEDYYVYIPSTDAGIQAVENDPDLYDGTSEYFNSRQCDSVTGKWRLWNMNTNNWITTSYPCPLLGATNTWHHIREYTTISRVTGVSTYQSFEYDGVTIWANLGDSFPYKPLAGTAALNVEMQMDLNAGAGALTQVFYADNINMWVW